MPTAMRNLLYIILTSILICGGASVAGAYTLGDIGGDDVEIWQTDNMYEMSMDIADNGDIYTASVYLQPNLKMGIAVHRSQDDGTTWELWGSVTTAEGMGDYYREPCLEVVEGAVNKCYLAYTHYSNIFESRIMMASSNLADGTADFSSPVTVLSDPVEAYIQARFTTDVSSFNGFYIYLVAQARYLSGGDDIIFIRSTDYGGSFETPYKVGALASTDRDYLRPDISYGFGGYINVAWEFDYDSDTYDSALRFRRAANHGSAGIADWGSIYGLGTTSDGIDERSPKIQASHADNQVVIACNRREDVEFGYVTLDPGVYVSTDAGATYPTYTTIPDGVRHLGDVKEKAGSGQWFIGGQASLISGIHRADIFDLTDWSPLESFSDLAYPTNSTYVPVLALNPAQSDRVALVFQSSNSSADDELYFDAEWRADQGYPNLEPGFPVDLPDRPLAGPALVDMNGDGDQEIVFADDAGNIQIFQVDGTPLPGWPVNVGTSWSDSPVAVGDLVGNGEMYVVAGTENGLIYCFDSQGQLVPGQWPHGLAGSQPAYVAIGAFGQGPYPRGIAASVGVRGMCLDHKGGYFPGSETRNLARYGTYAPAIGDVDGDGLPEIVFAHEEVIVVAPVFTYGITFGQYMAAEFSGSPTLGDFDLDGNMEIVAPTANGELHVFDETGADIGSFPFTSSTASPLSSAAIGNMLGTGEPEIVVSALNWTVHLLYGTGKQGLGWPVETDGWYNYASPIIGGVEGSSGDVVMGSRGSQAWAWNNFGGVIPGWPKPAADNFYVTPAMGDIDQDGSSEIVLVSDGQLLVVDVRSTPHSDSQNWPMAGHDHQRTGCSDCPEDVVTPVEDGIDAVTRVSFAQPSPNPSSGSATFRFSVPGPAVVNLEVFDVRGHRVSLVTREEIGMGNHVASWGGLSDRGTPLASGIYFARLRVQGPGINEELTRKITLAR